METFIIKTLQLLLSLSILVIVHEFGHFIFARMFGIRVEKFYLFFDPWFSIFKFKPKNSHTEYGIGWLPLGGYVKISGMIDESMDKEQMSQPAKSWEFRSKPAWQRLLVMVAGVLFNFLLAIFILSMIVYTWGDTYIPYKSMKGGMMFSEVMKADGFRDKDILISADGEDLKDYNSILSTNTLMSLLDAKEVIVERDGQQHTVKPSEDLGEKVIASKMPPFTGWLPTVIDSIGENTAASEIGMQLGDSIVAFNGEPVESFFAFKSKISAVKNDSINISFYRNDSLYSAQVYIDSTSSLGFIPRFYDPIYEKVTDRYSFIESFPVGIKKGVETLKGYVSQSRFIFTKEGAKNVGGFGAIGSMFPPEWDWHIFWTMTAFLSIALAFLNILPIPALDGGHIVFLLYEVIARRKPNEKFMEYAQIVGMFLLLGLILFANGNDLIRWIMDKL
ncbi:RIP metalloprotease RseP [Dysgonomonas massiliensis]|uniref:RIP metalloprotease RseP n=1 Tax=Dysgonomonas massiliensis TaxID=2040292 RepID=UPI000C7564EB|nr:RIP metalloprotease RseP [Dysgonomonas massiliensis]